MTANYLERAKSWLNEGYDDQTKKEVELLLKGNSSELEDCFYKNLEFGTGGLRGIMGVGTNRMNKYTVGMATQGLANYLLKEFASKEAKSVAIAFDSRNNSPFFAKITADVFAANGFKVYLFKELRPTPQLSFTIRDLGCVAGVMVTASHNPKEYNGYKAYWEDGAQVTSPHDKNIIEEVLKITNPSMVKFDAPVGSIEYLGEEADNRYLDAILSLTLSPEIVARHNNFKIVYTPLHGTGVKMVPEALKRVGFSNVIGVAEQNIPDGNFPTVKSPNPEESSALEMAMKLAKEEGADLVMATDPDADRVGIAVRDKSGELVMLNGNQTAAILIYYILERRRELGRLDKKHYIVKTIVTTDLLKSMADSYGVDIYNVLTGFKYIAEVVRENEGKREFIGGGEESYGFNVGEYVRDKDAVIACCFVAEAAAWAADKGKSLYDLLIDIYVKYGFYKERLLSVTKRGKEGLEAISAMMKSFREDPLQKLGESNTVLIHDYKRQESIDLISDLRYRINLPKSDVLQYVSNDNSIVSVRPSGTEPKIKFYFGVRGEISSKGEFDEMDRILDNKLNALEEQMKKY